MFTGVHSDGEHQDLRNWNWATFEGVNKNLSAYPFEVEYFDIGASGVSSAAGNGEIAKIIFDLGGGGTITKTFSYNVSAQLVNVVLSGSTPAGVVNLTKTLEYTSADNLTSVGYS